MKTPLLPACFAVAVTASAADLKDPDSVAREWQDRLAPPRAPLTSDLTLRGQTAPAPGFTEPALAANEFGFAPPSRRNTPRARDELRPPKPLYDLPGSKIPEHLPNNRPRGAVPWEYNGEVYWLVPLAATEGK